MTTPRQLLKILASERPTSKNAVSVFKREFGKYFVVSDCDVSDEDDDEGTFTMDLTATVKHPLQLSYDDDEGSLDISMNITVSCYAEDAPEFNVYFDIENSCILPDDIETLISESFSEEFDMFSQWADDVPSGVKAIHEYMRDKWGQFNVKVDKGVKEYAKKFLDQVTKISTDIHNFKI